MSETAKNGPLAQLGQGNPAGALLAKRIPYFPLPPLGTEDGVYVVFQQTAHAHVTQICLSPAKQPVKSFSKAIFRSRLSCLQALGFAVACHVMLQSMVPSQPYFMSSVGLPRPQSLKTTLPDSGCSLPFLVKHGR